VYDQLSAPRYDLPVLGVKLTADHRTMLLTTPPHLAAVNYAITTAVPPDDSPDIPDHALPQHATIDLLTDLAGVEGQWLNETGQTNWSGWLPHIDLNVARALLRASAP